MRDRGLGLEQARRNDLAHVRQRELGVGCRAVGQRGCGRDSRRNYDRLPPSSPSPCVRQEAGTAKRRRTEATEGVRTSGSGLDVGLDDAATGARASEALERDASLGRHDLGTRACDHAVHERRARRRLRRGRGGLGRRSGGGLGRLGSLGCRSLSSLGRLSGLGSRRTSGLVVGEAGDAVLVLDQHGERLHGRSRRYAAVSGARHESAQRLDVRCRWGCSRCPWARGSWQCSLCIWRHGADMIRIHCGDAASSSTSAASGPHGIKRRTQREAVTRTVVAGLPGHDGLVGLDLSKHLAGSHLVSLLDGPRGDVALRHAGRQGRHRQHRV